MKSDMPAYKDMVGSSAQKIRSVLQARGALQGFKSGIKDKSTAAISEELVNFIAI